MNARVISYNSFPCIYMTLPDILNMSLQLWNCKVLSRAIEAISLQKVGRHSGYGSRQNTNGNLHTWSRVSAEENLTTLVTWLLWKPHSISVQRFQALSVLLQPRHQEWGACIFMSFPPTRQQGWERVVGVRCNHKRGNSSVLGGQKEVNSGSRREVMVLWHSLEEGRRNARALVLQDSHWRPGSWVVSQARRQPHQHHTGLCGALG